MLLFRTTMQISRLPPIWRLPGLSPDRRRLVFRLIPLLTLSSAMIAVLPFRRAIRFGSIPVGRPRPISMADAVWAIETAARYLPLRTKCIEKGLAAQRLLRRSGRDARLHYGARTEGGGQGLCAHVWVSVEGKVILGGEEAPAFAEIAAFP